MREQKASSSSEGLSGEAGGVDAATTVLIVDDTWAMVSAMRAVLQHAGYQVLAAGDGQEALRIFSDQKDEIDLVILDLVMPRMDGKECLDALVELDPEVKVLVTTAHYLQLFLEETYAEMKLKAKGFIPKPCDPTMLLDLVADALRD